MAAEEHDGGHSPSVNPTKIDYSLDDLARGLASGTISRGKALRWMGSALVGAALASVPGVAWADDDRCPEGQTRCNDRCVNLQNNENHCGSCRNRCRSTQTCCKGRCVNLQRNENHCGSCFNRCAEEEECVAGMCEGEGCPPVACEGGTVNPGTCLCECPSPKTLQNGACVCPSASECGTQCCQTGETCVGGTTCCPNAQLCGTGTGAICCAEGLACDCNSTLGCVCRQRTTCTPGDTIGVCGSCTRTDGTTRACDCEVLDNGTTFCRSAGRCASSCDECDTNAGQVCVSRPGCNTTTGANFICWYPCPNGGTCPPFP